MVWVDLSDAIPPELGKHRPGIVVSNSVQNAVLETVVVVPLSSRSPEIAYLRLRISPVGKIGGFAVIPGIRQIKKSRILDVAGHLALSDLQRVGEAIDAYLSD